MVEKQQSWEGEGRGKTVRPQSWIELRGRAKEVGDTSQVFRFKIQVDRGVLL
jgi:hypothetical protein